MIATGLVFLLGALVATLLALLFVPFLWRNAQRLARRDFAATMPATMSEIRAEVDRVRAEAAMTVRRHEMQVQKAKERAALERAAVGRLTSANADMALLSDQRQGEANALRGQIETLEQRITALEETRLDLEQDNAALREALEAARDEAVSASRSEEDAGRDDAASDPEPARIAAATAALLALARDHRRDRTPDEVPVATSRRDVSPTASSPEIAELTKLANEPRPQDTGERLRRNADVRERISQVASRFLVSESAELSAGQTPTANEPLKASEPAEQPLRNVSGTPRPKRRRGSSRGRSAPR